MNTQCFAKIAAGLSFVVFLLIVTPTPAAEPDKPATPETPDWREQYAYSLGVQAYLRRPPVGVHDAGTMGTRRRAWKKRTGARQYLSSFS